MIRPSRPPAPDLDSDRYKLALFVGRVLSTGAYVRPGEPLPLGSDIPNRVATQVASLWQQAAGQRGTRPDAAKWAMALSDRQEIALQSPAGPPTAGAAAQTARR